MKRLALVFSLFCVLASVTKVLALPPAWVRAGLRASYFVFSGNTVQDPWGSGNNQAGVVTGYDHYVIREVYPQRVSFHETLWMEEGGAAINDNYTTTPINQLFHGPFWVDPQILQNLHIGDHLLLGTPDHPEDWIVAFIGPKDISPYGNEIKDLVGFNLVIPVPRGTIRQVIACYTEQNGQRFNLLIDQQLGLIYYISLSQLTGGVAIPSGEIAPLNSQLTTKTLAEINLDFTTLELIPPVNPFFHAGYEVKSVAYSISSLGQWVLQLSGVYKNISLSLESIFVGLNIPLSEMNLWQVEAHPERKDYDLELLESHDFTGNIREPGEHFRVSEFLSRYQLDQSFLSNLGEINIYVDDYSLKDIPNNIFDFSHLYLDKDNKMIIGATLIIGGQDLSTTTQTSNNFSIIELLNRIPTKKNNISLNIINDGSVQIGKELCQRPCQKQFPQGSTLHLRALPERGYRFVRWDGLCQTCGGRADCTIRFFEDGSCTAVFQENSVPNLIKGDVTGDNQINIIDALLLARCALFLTHCEEERADVNCDHKITILDALLVARRALHLPVPTWCE